MGAPSLYTGEVLGVTAHSEVRGATVQESIMLSSPLCACSGLTPYALGSPAHSAPGRLCCSELDLLDWEESEVEKAERA